MHSNPTKRRVWSKAGELLRWISRSSLPPADSPASPPSDWPPRWLVWTVATFIALVLLASVAFADGPGDKKEEVGEIANISLNITPLTVRFDPTGKFALLTGGQQVSGAGYLPGATGVNILIDLDKAKAVNSWLGGAPACFSPDGSQIIRGCYWLDFVDAKTGQLKGQLPLGKDQQSLDYAIAPDGKRLVVACGDGCARVFQYPGGKVLRQFPHGKGWTTAAWTTDSKALLTGGTDSDLRLWDVENDKQVKVCEHHKSAILLARVLDEKRAISVSSDGMSCVWDLKSGKELHSFTIPNFGRQRLTFPAWKPVFAPNWVAVGGDRLFVGHSHGGLTLWVM